MEQIKVESIGAETAQAALASRDRALPRCVLWQHFAHQKCLVASARDRFADELLGSAVAIHFGRVDQRSAKIKSEANGGDLLRDGPRCRQYATCPGPRPLHSRRMAVSPSSCHLLPVIVDPLGGQSASPWPLLAQAVPGPPGNRSRTINVAGTLRVPSATSVTAHGVCLRDCRPVNGYPAGYAPHCFCEAVTHF